MRYIDEKFKENPPGETVDRLKRILGSIGIETVALSFPSGIENCHSVRVSAKTGFPGQNGKGVTEEFALASGYAEFAERLSAYNMSQAEFIRQAITGAAIRPIITVSPVNDELLAAVGKLTAEYGRIGGNLNQIARTLNEWHSPYPQLAGEVRAAVSDLAALKFEVLQKVGDAVGNIQTYQL